MLKQVFMMSFKCCHDPHHGSITKIRSMDLPKEDVDESQHSTDQGRPANDKKYSTRITYKTRTETIKLVEYLSS